MQALIQDNKLTLEHGKERIVTDISELDFNDHTILQMFLNTQFKALEGK